MGKKAASIDASGGKDGFRGGEAFRPSINSYMFANSRAISRLAALAGDKATARRYAAKAADLNDPWNTPFEYRVPGDNGPYDIVSYGADRKPGGESVDADIRYE